MKKIPIPIFVSSTYSDLVLHRERIRDMLIQLGESFKGMEYFGSRPGKPKEECLRELRRCRVYIGIIGTRYGSIDPEEKLSYTHLEALEADRLGIPILFYLINEEEHLVLPKHVDRGDNFKRLESFRKFVMEKFTVSFFESPDDLSKKISTDVSKLAREIEYDDQKGMFASMAEGISRIRWLNEERFEFLKNRIGALAEKIPNRDLLHEVFVLLLSGERQAAVFLMLRQSGLDGRESIDLLMEIEKVLGQVIREGMEKGKNNI